MSLLDSSLGSGDVALGRWQLVLVDALARQPAIGVRATVAQHLGREGNRAELIAARRAAHGLDGIADVVHVAVATSDQVGERAMLVLVRCGLRMEVSDLK